MDYIGKIIETFKYISKLWKIIISIAILSLLFFSFEIIVLILESFFPAFKNLKENLPSFSIIELVVFGVLVAIILVVLFFVPKTVSSLDVISIQDVNNRNDNNIRSLYILLRNSSSSDIILNKFYVKWRYDHGMAASIDEGKIIKPLAQYHFELAIDTDDNNQRIQTKNIIHPIKVSGSGIAMIEVDFSYYFDGRLKYHPCCDWNIIYDLEIVDINNVSTTIFTNRTWDPVYCPGDHS